MRNVAAKANHLAAKQLKIHVRRAVRLNVVMQWKYKPVSCGGHAVRAEAMITVTSTLGA